MAKAPLAIALLALLGLPAAAKETRDLSLQGRVIDRDGKPLPSLTVQLKESCGPGVAELQHARTDDLGRFELRTRTEMDRLVVFIKRFKTTAQYLETCQEIPVRTSPQEVTGLTLQPTLQMQAALDLLRLLGKGTDDSGEKALQSLDAQLGHAEGAAEWKKQVEGDQDLLQQLGLRCLTKKCPSRVDGLIKSFSGRIDLSHQPKERPAVPLFDREGG